MVNLWQAALAYELPTKRRHAEFSVYLAAALVSSADTILRQRIYNNDIEACIADAVGTRRSATPAASVAGVIKAFLQKQKDELAEYLKHKRGSKTDA